MPAKFFRLEPLHIRYTYRHPSIRMLEQIEEIESEFERVSKLGKRHIVKSKRMVYHITCDACGRKLTRSKGEAYKLLERERHACSPECVGKLGRKPGYKPRPKRRKSGYIYLGKRREHQIVAEQMLGRKLTKGEVVHHINGDKGDNREENLLVTTKQEHNRIHGQLEGLSFLLLQRSVIWFCRECRLYSLKEEVCGCGSSFSA